MVSRIVYADTGDGRDAVVDALSAADYDVTPVGSVAAARERLADADAVVTAASLPDGDALDLCRTGVGPPVVVYAAEPDASFASRLFAAGASDYVLRDEVAPDGLADRVAAAVARSEGSRYRRLVETLGDFVYSTDAEGRFTTVNDAAVDLSGYTREELLGEHVSVVLEESAVERGRAAIRELLRGDAETITHEITLVAKDGTTRHMENHVALLPAPDGTFRGTVGVLRDVSRRRQRADRLRELHRATRELFAAESREAAAEITVRAAETILGYPINGVRFREGDRLVPVAMSDGVVDTLGDRPDYDVDGDSNVAAAYRSGDPLLSTSPDGADVGRLGATYHLPLGEHGTLSIGALDEAGFDETDRMLARVLVANVEAALDRLDQRAALATERDRLSALFENIPDPAVYVEYEGDTPIARDVNPAFEETFGYDADRVVGESVDEFIVPTDRDGEADSYNEQIRSGRSFHGEVRRATRDGVRDFLLHVVPYEIGAETTRGFAIYTDITGQKERQRELERQNERLDQFATVVSHDLRNPLNVAAGRLELAQETGDDEHFDAAARALDRMEQLIEGLLALARQGRTVGDTERVALGDAVEAAWNTVAVPEATLEFDDLPTIRADRSRLEQLLENLFRNAVDHAGEDATVTVGPLPDGFYVADDGPGLPADAGDDVFEFGYSSDDGTGFGLAIVRSIAEAHGWTVDTATSTDGGARFDFTGVSVE
jgi:PAS domain S-box-containing protein